jgi:t-SNARE complex subunit (syntaxin)
MLNDLDNKTEKTQTKMDKVNDRMKDALEKINDKSTNFCIYIICIVMLLGLATVVYKMVETSKK